MIPSKPCKPHPCSAGSSGKKKEGALGSYTGRDAEIETAGASANIATIGTSGWRDDAFETSNLNRVGLCAGVRLLHSRMHRSRFCRPSAARGRRSFAGRPADRSSSVALAALFVYRRAASSQDGPAWMRGDVLCEGQYAVDANTEYIAVGVLWASQQGEIGRRQDGCCCLWIDAPRFSISRGCPATMGPKGPRGLPQLCIQMIRRLVYTNRRGQKTGESWQAASRAKQVRAWGSRLRWTETRAGHRYAHGPRDMTGQRFAAPAAIFGASRPGTDIDNHYDVRSQPGSSPVMAPPTFSLAERRAQSAESWPCGHMGTSPRTRGARSSGSQFQAGHAHTDCTCHIQYTHILVRNTETRQGGGEAGSWDHGAGE